MIVARGPFATSTWLSLDACRCDNLIGVDILEEEYGKLASLGDAIDHAAGRI